MMRIAVPSAAVPRTDAAPGNLRSADRRRRARRLPAVTYRAPPDAAMEADGLLCASASAPTRRACAACARSRAASDHRAPASARRLVPRHLRGHARSRSSMWASSMRSRPRAGGERPVRGSSGAAAAPDRVPQHGLEHCRERRPRPGYVRGLEDERFTSAIFTAWRDRTLVTNDRTPDSHQPLVTWAEHGRPSRRGSWRTDRSAPRSSTWRTGRGRPNC